VGAAIARILRDPRRGGELKVQFTNDSMKPYWYAYWSTIFDDSTRAVQASLAAF